MYVWYVRIYTLLVLGCIIMCFHRCRRRSCRYLRCRTVAYPARRPSCDCHVDKFVQVWWCNVSTLCSQVVRVYETHYITKHPCLCFSICRKKQYRQANIVQNMIQTTFLLNQALISRICRKAQNVCE